MDLKSNPFFLQDSDVAWVNGTLAAMSLKEKIEHLFCLLVKEKPAEEIIADLDLLDFQPGSYMTDIYPAQVIKTNFQKLQGRTAIPLLFASNLERGADGICTEGTLFGTQMQVAAAGDPRWAYELGRVCAQEAAALGANWNFSPVVDIDYDFHNPITNTRAFSSDPDIVRELSLAYIKGMRENGMAVCAKHFPGDGRDERDQHMVTSINDCSVDEWDQTYGKIYQAIIDAGAETIMAAQIMLPAYSRALRPNLKDEEILSGVLSYELKNDLLRDRLGFNGLIVTDATTMTGFMQVMARQDAIPLAIASGCDMILFAADLQEDRDYIYKGLERGVLTEQRLDEAVTRILALKARLGLHRKMATGTLFPPDNAINVFADGTNRQLAAECADCSVTLVKDTQWLLPISPVRHKRVLLHILGDQGGYHDPIKNTSDHFCARLSAEGFDITRFDPQDISLRPIGNSVKSMTDRFDLIIYYCSVKTSASDNVARIVWDHPGGCNTPRYIHEIPTLFISIDSPYMLFDAPVVKTYINGYTPSQYVIDAIVEKILGRSEFKGTSPVDPFCGLLNARF